MGSISDVIPVLGLIGLFALFGVVVYCLLSSKVRKAEPVDDVPGNPCEQINARAERNQCDGYSAGTFYW